MSLAVVGGRFLNANGSSRQFETMLCDPGERVDLRPEPKNPHDPRAVAVFSARGQQIGYLTAERCGRIGALIQSGREWRAVFQAPTNFGAWIRIAFDGEEPVVTGELPGLETSERDWWPDDAWPEE
ncbi:HIRAN domain-containing protein [Novosphingobium aquae]|uniref:HIRAN domain-containing protein n=1 Tax=Novosphingobium aquae TaxID=3133435 RepID=A0ABU8S3Y7_9SPHN